jgi:alpha-tubulin suppressor-like RCC1 family protein
VLLTRSGLVYCSGSNSFGQLGTGTKRASNCFVLVSDISHIPMRKVAAGSFSAAISKDSGDLYLWGTGVFGEFLTPH